MTPLAALSGRRGVPWSVDRDRGEKTDLGSQADVSRAACGDWQARRLEPVIQPRSQHFARAPLCPHRRHQSRRFHAFWTSLAARGCSRCAAGAGRRRSRRGGCAGRRRGGLVVADRVPHRRVLPRTGRRRRRESSRGCRRGSRPFAVLLEMAATWCTSSSETKAPWTRCGSRCRAAGTARRRHRAEGLGAHLVA